MLVESKLRYGGCSQVRLVKVMYGNGRMGLRAVDPDSGEPIAMLTVNMPDVILEPNEVIIKDYAENEGAFDTLEKAGLVTLKGSIPCGFTTAKLCTWNYYNWVD